MDSSRDLVLARLYLGAILPLLEDIAAFDQPLQEMIKEWDFKLQFQLSGGDPAATLIFNRGTVKAVRTGIRGPRVTLTFPNARFLNELFAGKSKKNPRPNLPGLFHLKKLMQLEKVLGRLEHYLKPGAAMLQNPETLRSCVELALYVLAFGLKEIGEHDPAAAPVTARLPDGILEINIVDGPAAHIAVQNGKFKPAKGSAAKVNAILKIGDLQTAWAMLQGKLDLFAAIGSGTIRLHGNLPLLDGINPLLDRLSLYLGA